MARLVKDCASGGSEPRYLAIRSIIRNRIADGTYAAGTAIPSEHELSTEFGTTRLTVRNAIDGLVTQGLIRRVQGKGAYVSRVGQGQHAHATGFRAWVKADESAPSVRQLSKTKRAAGRGTLTSLTSTRTTSSIRSAA